MELIESVDTTRKSDLKSLAVNRTIIISELVSFFYQEFPVGYQFKGESHNFWEFVVVLDGAATICAENEFFRLGKGQAIWHKPNEFHSVRTDGDKPLLFGVFTFYGWVGASVQSRIYNLDDSLCQTFIRLRNEADDIFTFHPDEERQAYLFKSLKYKKRYEMQIFISEMEHLLASSLLNDIENTPPAYSISEQNYLLIIQTIEKNLARRLSVPQIATLCNMSVSNAKKVFTKYAGCGIASYYNNMIINEAKRLLSTGLSVGETAEKLGFDNKNYFSYFFKKMTKLPPSHYEKLAKEERN